MNTRPRPEPLDLSRLKVLPLKDRRSLTKVEDILVAPESEPKPCAPEARAGIEACARAIVAARKRGASVILLYGAHLLRNGAALILEHMMARGWLTHVATNGAGSIHDIEYAYCGKSTESVRDNVAKGTFGAWDETSRHIHLALAAGALRGEGYGRSVGRFIMEDGATLPSREMLLSELIETPEAPLTAARADLLALLRHPGVRAGANPVRHEWKQASILGQAWAHGVPATVHPGIGYDIITNHPIFNGAVIGRAAGLDFRLFCRAVEGLDGGVVLSVGSAIMAPQVFEKSLACVHNLRFQAGRPAVSGHAIHVVDIQDGGHWDWTQGEPPKSNPAYYLRFCKSYARMGGAMRYHCCDNVAFIHNLYRSLDHL
jgi:hypothetical protein